MPEATVTDPAEPEEPEIPDTDDDEDNAADEPVTVAPDAPGPAEVTASPSAPAGILGFLQSIWGEIEKIGHVAANLKSEVGVSRNVAGPNGNDHSDALAHLHTELAEAHQNLRALASQGLGEAPAQPVSATGTESGTVPTNQVNEGQEAAGPEEANKAS